MNVPVTAGESRPQPGHDAQADESQIGYRPAQLGDGGHRVAEIDRGDPAKAVGVRADNLGNLIVVDEHPGGAGPGA